MATSTNPTASELTAALTSAGLPAPSSHFLTTLLSSQRALPPLPALLATAKHRLLSSDLTSTPSPLAPTTLSFPPNLSDPQCREQTLRGPIPVQVLGIDDLAHSRWAQIDALDAAARGETTHGREIIRVVAPEERDGASGDVEAARRRGQLTTTTTTTTTPDGAGRLHRLVLQDVKAQRMYGVELRPVQGVSLAMGIGAKMMLLSGATVARGVVLLEPGKAVVLGGRIEAWHTEWLENRRKDLEAGIEQDGTVDVAEV